MNTQSESSNDGKYWGIMALMGFNITKQALIGCTFLIRCGINNAYCVSVYWSWDEIMELNIFLGCRNVKTRPELGLKRSV